MTINFINPNFNLIGTARSAGIEQSGSGSNASGIGQNFSDILESVISSRNLQNHTAISETVSNKTAVNLDEIFQRASDTYHVPVELLKAVAKAESNFNPAAESHAGAQGIMQLMPGTAKSLGVTNAFDPEQNIMGGAKYLSQQLERYDGNPVLALAAYNAGPGNVAKYNGVPPFKETQNYIAKVMGYAGETITAGQAQLSPQITTGQAQITADDRSSLQELGLGLLNLDLGDLDIKDYALLMDLYRYKMQLNVLTDFDSDSKPNDFLGSFTSLV